MEAIAVNPRTLLWGVIGVNLTTFTVYYVLIVLEHYLYRGWDERSPFMHWQGQQAITLLPIIVLLYGIASVLGGIGLITGVPSLQRFAQLDILIGFAGFCYVFYLLAGAARQS